MKMMRISFNFALSLWCSTGTRLLTTQFLFILYYINCLSMSFHCLTWSLSNHLGSSGFSSIPHVETSSSWVFHSIGAEFWTIFSPKWRLRKSRERLQVSLDLETQHRFTWLYSKSFEGDMSDIWHITHKWELSKKGGAKGKNCAAILIWLMTGATMCKRICKVCCGNLMAHLATS